MPAAHVREVDVDSERRLSSFRELVLAQCLIGAHCTEVKHSSQPVPRVMQHHTTWRCGRAWIILLGATAAGLVADLCSKSMAFSALAGSESNQDSNMILLGGGIKLHTAWNTGAVFGLGSGQQLFFAVFTVAALALGFYLFVQRTRPESSLAHVALGVAIAGALGNFHDRLRFGAVRDFIQLLPGHRLPGGATWPGTNNPEMFPWVFNVADVLLLIGLLMTVHALRLVRKTAVWPVIDGPPPVPQPSLATTDHGQKVAQAERPA